MPLESILMIESIGSIQTIGLESVLEMISDEWWLKDLFDAVCILFIWVCLGLAYVFCFCFALACVMQMIALPILVYENLKRLFTKSESDD